MNQGPGLNDLSEKIKGSLGASATLSRNSCYCALADLSAVLQKNTEAEREFKNKGPPVLLKCCIKGLKTTTTTTTETLTHKQKTCCIVVVQYLAVTLTIINIHEPVTLQPLRMVKLIMLTGSFNCFIQSKQLSCNKWHNNYAHNLTRWQWQVEDWHPHLHKAHRALAQT